MEGLALEVITQGRTLYHSNFIIGFVVPKQYGMVFFDILEEDAAYFIVGESFLVTDNIFISRDCFNKCRVHWETSIPVKRGNVGGYWLGM